MFLGIMAVWAFIGLAMDHHENELELNRLKAERAWQN
jgi:hypothetical protein